MPDQDFERLLAEQLANETGPPPAPPPAADPSLNPLAALLRQLTGTMTPEWATEPTPEQVEAKRQQDERIKWTQEAEHATATPLQRLLQNIGNTTEVKPTAASQSPEGDGDKVRQVLQGLTAKRQPPPPPPVVTNPLAVLGTPGAAFSAGMGALIDRPGDLGAAGRAALDEAQRAPFASSVSELASPSGELTKRDIPVPGGDVGGMAMDVMMDPTNLIGGEPFTDIAKLGVAGAGKLGVATAAMLPAATAGARRTLQKSWPNMAAALTKHGGEVTLPGANRSNAAALDRLAADIHARTLAGDGSTTYPLTGAMETSGRDKGYMVGKYSNQSGKTKMIPEADFTVEDVRAFIEDNADEFVQAAQGKGIPLSVGTWKGTDKATGVPHVYLDVASKHDDVRKATQTAAHQKQPKGLVRDPVTGEWPKPQEAIWDLEKGDERKVGNLAEFVDSPEFQRRLDEMYEAGVPVMGGKNWWDLHGSDLESVYGTERLPGVAGFLASTSNATPPVANLRIASEYIRRWLKGEDIIQPDFRIPDTAVGSLKHHLGSVTPGDFARPGSRMPFEQSPSRSNNLNKVAGWGPEGPTPGPGSPDQISADKMNDMFHALLGDERAVIDRRYAKLAEDPERGVYVGREENVVEPVMGGKQVAPYALIENAVRTAAARRNMSLSHYSAYVWEGIGNTIKKEGKLYGVEHPAHAIPPASQGFPPIFTQMVKEKAAEWGISVEEFTQRLRRGDAELLTALLATPVGMHAFAQWQHGDQTTGSESPQPPLY